jgi:hypothetical protein
MGTPEYTTICAGSRFCQCARTLNNSYDRGVACCTRQIQCRLPLLIAQRQAGAVVDEQLADSHIPRLRRIM